MPERKLDYQVLQHKARTGFLVTAPSLQRLYIDAGLALTDLIVKQDRILDRERRALKVVAEGKEGLMTAWLNEILSLIEREGFLSRRIVFDSFDGKKIEATLWGDVHDRLRHGTLPEIKTLSHSLLEVGDKVAPEPHFYARIFVDF